MLTYLIVIEIILLALTFYESYKYFVFKYQTKLFSATVIDIQEFEMFQRPSTKMIQGEKRVQKITFEYEIDGKVYNKTEKTGKPMVNSSIGESINVKVLNHDPERYTLKPDKIRFRRMVFALIGLICWSVLAYLV